MLKRRVGEEESDARLEATPMVRRIFRRGHEEALRGGYAFIFLSKGRASD